ncbi:MAG: hypothetical protein ABSA06_09120 [Geobacteraceae bacterium]|jgi:hypothetical protein
MKKAFLAVLVAIVCLAGVGSAFAAPPVWIPGVLADTEDLVGVRYRSFANTADPGHKIYLGIPDLGVPANRLATDVTWADTNQITFTYSSTDDILTTQVTNGNGTFSLEFPGVAAAIKASGKVFTVNDINFLQITIVNGDTNTTVNLNDVFLNGASLGSFGGNGPYDWSVRDDTLNKGFTITGTLHLLGAFGTDPAVSTLEIKAGHVTPNNPPDCSKARPSKTMLWPPNHKFVKINVLGVTDPDGDPITIRIDSIFQDEPVNGSGDGNTSPDGKGIGASSAEVRAERQGSGNGRVYHIGFTADDGKGGTCSGVVLVGVPKSMGKKGGPVDDGALYNSTIP